MRRALLLVGLVLFGVASAQAAWAAPTTQVVQGQILRLISVADWDAAGSLHPGEPVQWDVAVSADAPDPGTVTISASADGDAALVVDASLCMREWTAGRCPGGATLLRSDWDIPRDGAEVALAQMADTETAHLRLSIALAADARGGHTDVRVHASGVGESVDIGKGGGDLAATGMSPVVGVLGGGAVLLVAGLVLVLIRRRGSDGDGGES